VSLPAPRSLAAGTDPERHGGSLRAPRLFDDEADPTRDAEFAPVSEIVLFQVGTHVFAAPVRDVVRIDAVRDLPAECLVLESALGTPFTQQRGIMVASPGAERALVVDQVIGFRTVLVSDVQPLPAFAAACMHSAALSGLVVLDEMPMPFIDLPTLLRENAARGGAAPP
jgi:chemotaxis signal transduction protein